MNSGQLFDSFFFNLLYTFFWIINFSFTESIRCIECGGITGVNCSINVGELGISTKECQPGVNMCFSSVECLLQLISSMYYFVKNYRLLGISEISNIFFYESDSSVAPIFQTVSKKSLKVAPIL